MNGLPFDSAPDASAPPAHRATLAPLATIPSSALLAGRPYVLIEHGGAIYWLRTTRAGKLILTK